MTSGSHHLFEETAWEDGARGRHNLTHGSRSKNKRIKMTGDISPDFQWNKKDWQTIQKVLPHEATPEAVRAFARYAYRLSDYGYWFLLSTLWVSYTGWSDLELWKQLFSSSGGSRTTSIMKPSELNVFRSLDQLHPCPGEGGRVCSAPRRRLREGVPSGKGRRDVSIPAQGRVRSPGPR